MAVLNTTGSLQRLLWTCAIQLEAQGKAVSKGLPLLGTSRVKQRGQIAHGLCTGEIRSAAWPTALLCRYRPAPTENLVYTRKTCKKQGGLY